MQTTSLLTVHDFTEAQERAYKLPIDINESWQWSMKEHIRTATLYKNGQLKTGKNDFKPVKNIVLPILNLHYRSEGFDVKDIVLFIHQSKQYFKSFLVKKFHEKWALEHKMDDFIDTLVESYVDKGGTLVKKTAKEVPEVVPLESIAFCDQTDLLSGPIGIKHFYSPDQLLEMASAGWGEEKNGANASLEETIMLSREEKEAENQDLTKAKTPGRYIEVYEIHGNMPVKFLDPTDTSGKYVNQMHIICFYQKNKGEKRGQITLFKAKETTSPFKFISRNPIHGRALGLGAVEELEEDQVWTNYDEALMLDMKHSASKTILKTTDPTVANKTKVRDLDNLSIVEIAPNTDLAQVDTFPRNFQLFEQSQNQHLDHARWVGAAQEAISGDEPSAGTPFKSVEFQAAESHSLHDYRKGKLAAFINEIYRDWVIPHIAKEITKGQEFLSELDLEELQYVKEALVTCQVNNYIKDRVLSGELVEQEEVDGYKEIVSGEFKKKGDKHFIKILEGELKNAPIDVQTNVAGKQKNLGQTVDKIVNIVRFIVSSNPMVLSSPGVWNLINQAIEKSGLDPVDFSDLADSFKKMQQQAMQQQMAQQPTPSPLPTQTPTNAY